MDWLARPTHPGLWWLCGPFNGDPPEPVNVRLRHGEHLVVEMIGHEDDFDLCDFKVGCRWMLAQPPRPPQ